MRANVRNKNRLQLNRETLRSLSPSELDQAGGGSVYCQVFSLKKGGSCTVILTGTVNIGDTGPNSMPAGQCGNTSLQTSVVINPSAVIIGP